MGVLFRSSNAKLFYHQLKNLTYGMCMLLNYIKHLSTDVYNHDIISFGVSFYISYIIFMKLRNGMNLLNLLVFIFCYIMVLSMFACELRLLYRF